MSKKSIAKADLHVHSRYSEHPSEWILKALGTNESYTEPEFIYSTAKKRGMNFITITDHNKINGVLLLKDKYPDEVFTGVETTTYFPEDNCKVHILIYGFTIEQFEQINKLRKNIYLLRDYIKGHNLAYSVAHATYSVNGKLRYEHLEKLMLLFDVFEGINGGRGINHNSTWTETLQNLTPVDMKELYEKHRIEPMTDTPWQKGITGGSDDHAGLFIGHTYSAAPAGNVEEYLDSLKKKQSMGHGRSNEFHSFAFAIYKIGYEFTKHKGLKLPGTALQDLNDIILNNKPLKFKDKIFLRKLKFGSKNKNDKTRQIILNLIDNKITDNNEDIDDKIDKIYDNIATLIDDYFSTTIDSIIKDINKIDAMNIFRKISSSLIGVLLTVPFISSLKHLFQDRHLLFQLKEKYCSGSSKKSKHVVWFTDTLADLNGVSVTLKKIGWLCARNNKNLTLVSSLLDSEINDELPPNTCLMPVINHFSPEFYSTLLIKIPSILKSLKKIYRLNPDEIIVSTPGPMGLLGLMAAKLFNIKCKGIFHTDFTSELEEILEEVDEIRLVDEYCKWFYNSCNQTLVPTKEYISILNRRGYNENKLTLFNRGIDISEYNYKLNGRDFLKDFLKLDEGTVLLYTGRISKDKNLEFLFQLYKRLKSKNPDIRLVFAGNGPYVEELKKLFKGEKDVAFPGKISQKILPYFYSGADLFLFPSTTDTFGMSVLEAQACGLVAVVSDVGGPKEIIVDGQTGDVARTGDIADWEEKISHLIDLKNNKPTLFQEFKEASIANVKQRFDWGKNLPAFFE